MLAHAGFSVDLMLSGTVLPVLPPSTTDMKGDDAEVLISVNVEYTGSRWNKSPHTYDVRWWYRDARGPPMTVLCEVISVTPQGKTEVVEVRTMMVKDQPQGKLTTRNNPDFMHPRGHLRRPRGQWVEFAYTKK